MIVIGDAGMVERCLQFQLEHAVRLFIFSQQSQPAFVVRPESRSFFSFLTHRSLPSVLSQAFVKSIIVHRLFDDHFSLVNGHAATHIIECELVSSWQF